MHKPKLMKNLFILAVSIFLVSGCSRKTAPSETTSRSVYGSDTNTSPSAATTTPAATKPVVKQVKTAVPKVIVVNDAGASKTFDGRLYYDLEGHRYWKNYKDGKYYLYNKSMNNDPNFKKP